MNAETELELEGSDDSSDEDYNPAGRYPFKYCYYV